MCSFGYFGNITNTYKINLISPKNAQKFYIEKYTSRDKLDFQLKHVSRTELVTHDNKIYEFWLTRLKSPNKMNVSDYVIVRGQQVFEEGREINPIEIKIEDNRIRNFFDKYKNEKVKFKLIGLLVASSVQNDTENFFFTNDSFKIGKVHTLKRRL